MPYSHGSADARRESNRRRASNARTNVSAISSSARLCPTRSWRYRNTVAACRSNSTSNSSGWLSERRISTASLGVVVLIDPGFAADADAFQFPFKRSDRSPITVEPRASRGWQRDDQLEDQRVRSWGRNPRSTECPSCEIRRSVRRKPLWSRTSHPERSPAWAERASRPGRILHAGPAVGTTQKAGTSINVWIRKLS